MSAIRFKSALNDILAHGYPRRALDDADGGLAPEREEEVPRREPTGGGEARDVAGVRPMPRTLESFRHRLAYFISDSPWKEIVAI